METIAIMTIFQAFFPWNKARINCLANVVIALIKVRSVNLVSLSQAFSGDAKSESNYKRLQRFFRGFDLSLDLIAKLIFSFVPFEGKMILCLDRTNWKFGKCDINFLVLGIAYKGVAMPVLWSLLDKRGNSNSQERIDLLRRYINLFGVEGIGCLTADREFIGKEWLTFLKASHIPFRLRIRNNSIINSDGRAISAYRFFSNLPPYQERILRGKQRIWGLRLYVVGIRLPDNDYVILISDAKPTSAMDDYGKRWAIESLFSCLKIRGFNFEDTHITHQERLSKLMAILAIAFVWCLKLGEQLDLEKPLPVKKHGRRTKSLFKRGLDQLRSVLLDFTNKFQLFYRYLDVLSCS